MYIIINKCMYSLKTQEQTKSINYKFLKLLLFQKRGQYKINLLDESIAKQRSQLVHNQANFQKKQSPVKLLKQKQIQRQRNLRISKLNPASNRIQPNINVIDPLPAEINSYKQDTTILKTFQSSRAANNLRKYLIEQQKNLKCLRLERISEGEGSYVHDDNMISFNGNKTFESRYFDSNDPNQIQSNNPEIIKSLNSQNELEKSVMSGKSLNKSRNAGIHFDFLQKQMNRESIKQENKPIDIPKIQKLFDNQQKQYVLFQSRLMKNSLQKAIISLNKNVEEVQNKRYRGMRYAEDSLINTQTNLKLSGMPSISSSNHNNNSVLNDDDMEIDDRIQKKLKRSEKLRQKLYKQKKQLQNHHHSNKQSSQPKSLKFFIEPPKKPKKQILLKGHKSVIYNNGERMLQVMPASSLLFQLNRLGKGKLKKQKQLSGLLTNSYKNRDDILDEKSSFYDEQTPFNDLSASSQFRLRKSMDKKLVHRLQLSRQQVNKFTSYLYQIKGYHVILGDIILDVLKQVRQELMSGKIMKAADLTYILNKMKGIHNDDQGLIFKGHPNQKIVEKLFQMMI